MSVDSIAGGGAAALPIKESLDNSCGVVEVQLAVHCEEGFFILHQSV